MEESKQFIENVKPNKFCFRWGFTGTDVTLRYSDIDDLIKQISDLDVRAKEIRHKLDEFKFKMTNKETGSK